MAFEDLRRSLTERTGADIDALLASARDQAAALSREADRRCAERSAAALRDHARAVDAETVQAVAEAVRRARRDELVARARARDRVFVAARGRLAALARDSSYRETVPDRFAAALAVIGDGPADVRCAPGLAAPLTNLAGKRGDLAVLADPSILVGFSIRTRDGRVEVDEVLEHRLVADADPLAIVALRAIEKGP